MTYTLTLTEAQARTISMACDVFARLGMGQFIDALQHIPQKEGIDWLMWHDDMRTISSTATIHAARASTLAGIGGIWTDGGSARRNGFRGTAHRRPPADRNAERAKARRLCACGPHVCGLR